MKPTLEVLIEARRLIETGQNDYVCHAVLKACMNLRVAIQDAVEMQSFLMKQLDGRGTLDSFIAHTYHEPFIWWATPEEKNLQCLMRLAWLDKMISEAS